MKVHSSLSWRVSATWLLVANCSFLACSADNQASGTGGSSGAATAGGAGHGGGGIAGHGGNANGGTTAGGSAQGGSGALPSGGASSVSGGGHGGSLASGGRSSGGSANGGDSNGGHPNGGQPNGGSANGGQSSGGHANSGGGGFAGTAAGSGAGGASGSGHGGNSGAGPTMAATQAVFNARCVNCHDASKTGLPAYPSLPLTSDAAYDALVSHPADETCGGTRVVPFDSAHSYLFRKVSDAAPCSGVQMPHRPEVGPATPLSATELETIRAWIDGGAHP